MKKKSNLSNIDWEEFYKNENPWGFDGIRGDLIRIKIINDCFKEKNFKNGIDIACGEGYLLNKLNFIRSKSGVDISKTAINRAKKTYPNIKFYVGNPFLEFKINEKFEFVSCFEALYYPSSLKERKKALKKLIQYGSKNATYAFSVVTIGKNKHRNYFTRSSFLKLLSENFRTLKIVPITANYRIPFFQRILIKLLFFLRKKYAINLSTRFVRNAKREEIYQELFICKKL
ncbi:MAG: methyltransferase domain-containing protein [Prochlorococcus marinus CUG1436]|nr:methyltransferase domain-containing protein [Prochlorococcus marinus CUG1436]